MLGSKVASVSDGSLGKGRYVAFEKDKERRISRQLFERSKYFLVLQSWFYIHVQLLGLFLQWSILKVAQSKLVFLLLCWGHHYLLRKSFMVLGNGHL